MAVKKAKHSADSTDAKKAALWASSSAGLSGSQMAGWMGSIQAANWAGKTDACSVAQMVGYSAALSAIPTAAMTVYHWADKKGVR